MLVILQLGIDHDRFKLPNEKLGAQVSFDFG